MFLSILRSECTFHFNSQTEKAIEQLLKKQFHIHVNTNIHLEIAERAIFLTITINRLLRNSSRSAKDLYQE